MTEDRIEDLKLIYENKWLPKTKSEKLRI
jgi:hypothetical protein